MATQPRARQWRWGSLLVAIVLALFGVITIVYVTQPTIHINTAHQLYVPIGAAALPPALATPTPSPTLVPTPTPLPPPTPTLAPGATPSPTGMSVTANTQVTILLEFSQVDYPLQVPVNASDVVTVTLSPSGAMLTVTPTPGRGAAPVGAPLTLPTDVADYLDIGVTADTFSTGTSPVVWQLIGAPRRSLLTQVATGTPRAYLDQVVFQWRVRAVAAGANLVEITLRPYYQYRDGTEQDGVIELTESPVPIVAVQPSPTTPLATVKNPLAAASFLASLVAALRFLFGLVKRVDEAITPVRDAANVAIAVRTRLEHSDRDQPTQGSSTSATASAPSTSPAAPPRPPVSPDLHSDGNGQSPLDEPPKGAM